MWRTPQFIYLFKLVQSPRSLLGGFSCVFLCFVVSGLLLFFVFFLGEGVFVLFSCFLVLIIILK